MVFAGLLSRLFGKGPALTLFVQGVITEQGRHQPRTRLGPEQAPEEAYFALDVTRAWLSDGGTLATETIRPNEFSAELASLERFAVGDRVEIECTTATGRVVRAMRQLVD